MRIQNLGSWLRPTIFAPWLAMTAYTTVAIFLFGHHDPLLGGPFSNWVVAMVAGTIMTSLISAALVGVDLTLVRRGVIPPVGMRAWLSGALAYAFSLGLFELFPPLRHEGVLFWISMVWPLVAGVIVARAVCFRRGPSAE